MIKNNENHQTRNVYYYGFQIVIGELVKTFFLILVSFFLGILVPTLVMTFTFSSLRILAGGYHMNTYGKCLAVSMLMFWAAALITKYAYPYLPVYSILLLLAFSFAAAVIIIKKYAPGDTPNKPITEKSEIKKFKKLSLIHIFIWSVVMLVLIYFKQYCLVVASCFGILLELFTITPSGYSFFDKISGRMSKSKGL